MAGGTLRIAYPGRPRAIGSYVEVIQMAPEVNLMMSQWRQAAADWDGIHRISYLNHAPVTPS